MATVNLISSDSVKFVVEESVAKKSQLLKNMIEGIGGVMQTLAQRRIYSFRMSRRIPWRG